MAKTEFTDYEGFVEKFEVKRTTDDCYTPPEVYETVLRYVRSVANIDGLEIVRPFYPGGDFESFDYPANAVVIDNPPFSIITKIARHYIDHGVKFFLFAPSLTLLTDVNCTAVVVGAEIIYANGAEVRTSFLTNLIDGVRVLAAPELYKELDAINKRSELPKYDYPNNVLMVSHVQKYVERGIPFAVSMADCRHIRALDSQRPHKKAMFGGGLLLSDRAAAERVKAEELVQVTPTFRSLSEKRAAITWSISPRERELIDELGTPELEDINGDLIRVGDQVRTKQHTGGFLSPAPSQVGKVIEIQYGGRWQLAIEFTDEKGRYSQILLHGQINEII